MASIFDGLIGGVNDFFGNDPNDNTNALMRFGQGLQGGQQNQLPSALQEWAAYQKMTPEQQQQYLLVKRANPLLNQGNQFGSYNPVTQAVTPVAPINPKVSEMPDFKGAQTRAEEEAKALAAKETAYPGIAKNADMLIANINDALAAEGLDKNFGIIGQVPNIPGGQSADALAKLKKIGGGVFLQAYGQLRGGGQITEVEGKKAEQAFTNLESAQSAEAARKELRTLMDVVTGAKAEAAKGTKYENQNFQATGSPAIPAAGQKVRVQAPDGTTGSIDASELENAIANGWKKL